MIKSKDWAEVMPLWTMLKGRDEPCQAQFQDNGGRPREITEREDRAIIRSKLSQPLNRTCYRDIIDKRLKERGYKLMSPLLYLSFSCPIASACHP